MGIHYILQTLCLQDPDIRIDRPARAEFQDWEASGEKAATTWETAFCVPASGSTL